MVPQQDGAGNRQALYDNDQHSFLRCSFGPGGFSALGGHYFTYSPRPLSGVGAFGGDRGSERLETFSMEAPPVSGQVVTKICSRAATLRCSRLPRGAGCAPTPQIPAGGLL